jgi:hypothetical protein
MLSERMDKVSQYRGNAQECRRLCASVTDSQQKAMLERMAETWESLAADFGRRAENRRKIAYLEDLDGGPSIGS